MTDNIRLQIGNSLNLDYDPKYNEDWYPYDVTENEENVPANILKMSPEFMININKDKTQLYIYNSYGDQYIYDLKTNKITCEALGF